MRSILLRCPVLHDLPREPSEELKLVVTQQHVELDVKRCWYFGTRLRFLVRASLLPSFRFRHVDHAVFLFDVARRDCERLGRCATACAA